MNKSFYRRKVKKKLKRMDAFERERRLILTHIENRGMDQDDFLKAYPECNVFFEGTGKFSYQTRWIRYRRRLWLIKELKKRKGFFYYKKFIEDYCKRFEIRSPWSNRAHPSGGRDEVKVKDAGRSPRDADSKSAGVSWESFVHAVLGKDVYNLKKIEELGKEDVRKIFEDPNKGLSQKRKHMQSFINKYDFVVEERGGMYWHVFYFRDGIVKIPDDIKFEKKAELKLIKGGANG